MAIFEFSRERGTAELAKPVELVCFALLLAHAVYLCTAYLDGIWIVARGGGGIPSDFVNVWAAGRLAIGGHAASAYDWPTHKAMEEIAVGHGFVGYFGWPYPPPFLFVAVGLSLLSYPVAFVVWVFGTFPLYLAAIRAIVGERFGYLLAAAFPPVLANFIVGQNAFLTTGLIGGALLLLERRPIIAGVLIGLLSFKPHLGLLFPIVLVANGSWVAFASAAAVAALMAATAWAAFGIAAWQAFFANIGHASQAFLSNGWADWSKLQTAFGLTRALGGSEALAWSAQAAIAFGAAVAVALLWRSRASREIKAAAFVVGAMLATPYLFTYDLAVLAVPLAFLFRLGRARGFLPYEMAAGGGAYLLLAVFPFVKAPVGFAAVLIVAALVARRVFCQSAAA
jgi:arabinofuranan 3-O-arabinosyltransferase